jgi:drug/metabolite transporter (DMT)-like permease
MGAQADRPTAVLRAGTGTRLRLRAWPFLVGAALRPLRWEIALVGVAAIWGATYVVVRDAITEIEPSTFLAYRFTAAAVMLAPVCMTSGRQRSLPTVGTGAILGTVLFVAYGLQTVGLQHTGASQAAFITGLMVVLTPLLSTVLLGEPLRSVPTLAAVLAVPGLGLLSLNRMQLHSGDLLVLGCAVALAVHLLLLGHHAPRHDPYLLAVAQLATVGLLSLAWAGAASDLAMPRTADLWIALIITATLASAAAFAVQTIAQRVVPPTRAALILALEPVFAAITGHLTGEHLQSHRWGGAALILVSTLVISGAPSHPSRRT